MTIKTNQISKMEKLGAKFIGSSTIWDIRGCEQACSIDGRNLKKKLTELYLNNPTMNKIIVLVGARGRTQHSATELNIFSYNAKKWEGEMAVLSNSNCWELFLRKEFY